MRTLVPAPYRRIPSYLRPWLLSWEMKEGSAPRYVLVLVWSWSVLVLVCMPMGL